MENRDEKFLKDHGCTTWGDYNHPPLPYKECDISHFWGQFNAYGIRDVEFRQVYFGDKSIKPVHILIYSDVIYMIHVAYSYSNVTGQKFTPVCYVVGCDHGWDIDVNIRGIGKRTCRKCQYSEPYDCSD